MKRLHRYLLAELVLNAALTVVAILAIFFMVALALVLGASRAEGVPFSGILRHTGYQAVSTLYLTLPLTVLASSIFTYGRARADGEFTAMRVAGIHPWQTIIPALLVGAVCTCSLAWLQGDAMPAAHFRGRVELEQDVLTNIESVLKKNDRTIEEDTWSASWEALRQDEDGHLVLVGLQLFLLDDDRNPKDSIWAKWAKPRLDRRTNILTLRLHEVRHQRGDGPVQRAGTLVTPLHLGNFGTKHKNKRESDCGYEELLVRAEKYEVRAFAGPPGKARSKLLEKAREYHAEYHQRVAFAFSGMFFSFLGAALGLWRGTSNRALVFLVGFLVVIGLYYPLEMAGSWMAVEGFIPIMPALWIGNAALAALAAWIFRKVLRP